jgi:hypothetical protein
LPRFKLFEEFNPYTGLELSKKLRLFAQGSESAIRVTEIDQDEKVFVFKIYTNIPANIVEDGEKIFRVEIPFSQVEGARIITYDSKAGSKKEFETAIEVDGENDLNVILMNFLEATQLYDDGSVQNLVDSSKHIHTIEDIKRIIKTHIPQH